MLKDIFKGYDIRGRYPDELNEDVAYNIGRAFIAFAKVKQVAIGRDVRVSSPSLFNAFVKGILEQGADVIDLGLCTTPLLNFAAKFYGFEAAVNITASHNPEIWNGFKLYANGQFLDYEEGISQIAKIVINEKLPPVSKKKGSITKKRIWKDYVRHVRSFIDEIPEMKIVIDTGNGMAGLSVPKVFEGSKIKIIPLYFELDGTFPNHEPNPIKIENMHALMDTVKKEKGVCFGAAFDGDADRIIFCDEKGRRISPDLIGAMIAKEVLRKNKGAKVLYDLRSSKAVKEEIEAAGGVPVMSRVGHAYIKIRMRKEDIIFGEELSGHYYYKDNFFFDCGIITLMKVLSCLKRHNKPLSKLVKPIERYFHTRELNFQVDDKDAKINQIKEHYQAKAKNIFELDGLSVEFDDWWFNLRKSNTEALLRLNLEADTKKLMEKKRDEVMKLIKQKVS